MQKLQPTGLLGIHWMLLSAGNRTPNLEKIQETVTHHEEPEDQSLHSGT
jgi:hypothetical protein